MPVSGQDGDQAALNRIALGTQTVSVWKDARELGKKAAEIALAARRRQEARRRRRRDGVHRRPERQSQIELALPRRRSPITKDNLNVVIDAGWVTKDVVCQGVAAGSVAACN